MRMKKLKIFGVIAAILIMIPVEIMASSLWTGNGESHVDLYMQPWGVTGERIAKVNNPGEVYSINDLETY